MCYLRRRLLVYTALTLLGGIAHDFVPSLPRALLPGPNRTSYLNAVFVKFGWAWNLLFLVPLVALAGHAYRGLATVQLDRVEASIEQYHDRRLKQLLQVQQQQTANGSKSAGTSQPLPSTSAQSASTSSINFAVPQPTANKTIVTLQSLSSSATAPANAIEQYQRRILAAEAESSSGKSGAPEIISKLGTLISMLLCRDLLRLSVCSALYYLATSAFIYIGGGDNGNQKLVFFSFATKISTFFSTII